MATPPHASPSIIKSERLQPFCTRLSETFQDMETVTKTDKATQTTPRRLRSTPLGLRRYSWGPLSQSPKESPFTRRSRTPPPAPPSSPASGDPRLERECLKPHFPLLPINEACDCLKLPSSQMPSDDDGIDCPHSPTAVDPPADSQDRGSEHGDDQETEEETDEEEEEEKEEKEQTKEGTEQQLVEEKDEIDGVLPSFFLDAVKTAVLHLLNIVIRKYQRDYCNGCLTNHPSQKQHQCLDVLQDNFYQDRFYTLMRRLCTPRFIPAIQRLLRLRNIKTEDGKVNIVAQTVLHELKSARQINEVIHSMYDDMIAEDVVKIAHLRMVTECWNEGNDDE